MRGTARSARTGDRWTRCAPRLLDEHRAAKARAVERLAEREGIDLSRSYAYGDSTHDVPTLSLVGNPVAINPDRGLRRHAAHAGWPVQEFTTRG